MDYRYEIWDSPDDWAQVAIDRTSGDIVDVITGYWDWSGQMTYDEGVDWLKENGYAEYRDSFDSWDELDEYYSS